MKSKTIILLLAIAIPISVNASILFENIDLAKKAHQLSLYIEKLSDDETVDFCKANLDSAAIYSELAAELLASDYTLNAKEVLGMAIGNLSYTAIENCTQASNILIAKNEAIVIRDSIK